MIQVTIEQLIFFIIAVPVVVFLITILLMSLSGSVRVPGARYIPPPPKRKPTKPKSDKYRIKFEAEIIEKAFTSENNHGILKIRTPYNYDKIAGLDRSKKIKVTIKQNLD